jgi:hypothetical protein
MTLEQDTKRGFARVFEKSDGEQFKIVAQDYLRQAAYLRKKHLRKVPRRRRLLARNSQKRLFIGVAVELLLKAIYLQRGYRINKLTNRADLPWPYTAQQVQDSGLDLNPDETWELNDCIQQLKEDVLKLEGDRETVLEGLKIAKVYRNKEAHIVASTHRYVPAEYRKIESALTLLYHHAFNEKLELHFSIEPGEKARFRIT